jgi:hypothetical protein
VLFTQQIGRGLRRHPQKSTCLILDFIGQHRKEYRLENRLGSLMKGNRKDIVKQVTHNFPYLPAGCHVELDRVAKEVVLDSLKAGIPSRWNQKVSELRAIAEQDESVTLSTYLHATGMDLKDVYTGSTRSGWSQLCEDAGLVLEPKGPFELELRKSVGRLLHVTDSLRLEAFLEPNQPTHQIEKRLQKMLLSEMFQSVKGLASDDLSACKNLLEQHTQVVKELKQLLDFLKLQTDHLHQRLDARPNLPLLVHARYSRNEILAAFEVGDPESVKSKPWREGATWSDSEKSDVFVVTLNKSEGNFSPTTMYRDYALTRELFHWESQSQVREDSPRGKRYQNHESEGSSVMLFVRKDPNDRAFWFLGPATYVKHTSEKPMEVTWKLKYPLPGDLFEEFAAAVA